MNVEGAQFAGFGASTDIFPAFWSISPLKMESIKLFWETVPGGDWDGDNAKDKSVTNITLVEVSLFAASKDKAGEPRGFSRGWI